MTAKNKGKVLRLLSYAIGAHSAKKLVQVTLPLARTLRSRASSQRTPSQSRRSQRSDLGSADLISVLNLIEERITHGDGVGIPLARALVGRQCRRPHRVGTVVAMHRKIETVSEEQLRPLPPAAEFLDPTQQIVPAEQGRRHG